MLARSDSIKSAKAKARSLQTQKFVDSHCVKDDCYVWSAIHPVVCQHAVEK